MVKVGKYYIILGHSKEPSILTSSHIYPVYFSSYDGLKTTDKIGLQGNIHDALKFLDAQTALRTLEIAVDTYGDTYDFEMAKIDRVFFGRCTHKWVLGCDE